MKKKYLALALAAVVAFGAAACGKEVSTENTDQTAAENTDTTSILQAQMPAEGDEIAVITTSAGVVKMMFYPEEAPKAVENFKTLAKSGYYDGLLFHRVIDNFMVQTGDPEGTGRGGKAAEANLSPMKFPRNCITIEGQLPWQTQAPEQTAASSSSCSRRM